MRHEANMDAATNEIIDEAFTFDLLHDDFQLEETDNITICDMNIPSDITDLLDKIQAGQPLENQSDAEAFENENLTMRFRAVTEADLDNLEQENNAKSTHWQTNWAVGVLRGDYDIIALLIFE